MSAQYQHDKIIIDYYALFNIKDNAGKEEIRSAFCNLIKIYHPDISGRYSDEDIKKIDLIIKGYKLLIDDILRRDYDRHLFSDRNRSREGFFIIPKKRIIFSTSLKNILTARLSMKKMKHSDILRNLGQDVEIFITNEESMNGAVAYIGLPSRIYCPICSGSDPECHICNGVGRISTVSKIEIKIPPNINNGTVVDIDLMKARPDKFTSFTRKTLKIKITLLKKQIK